MAFIIAKNACPGKSPQGGYQITLDSTFEIDGLPSLREGEEIIEVKQSGFTRNSTTKIADPSLDDRAKEYFRDNGTMAGFQTKL